MTLMYGRRLIIWSLALALILGLGGLKSAENRRSALAERGLLNQNAEAKAAKAAYRQRIEKWIAANGSLPDARARIAAELNGGRPLQSFRLHGSEFFTLSESPHGCQMVFSFSGDALHGHFFQDAVADPFVARSVVETIRGWIANWGILVCCAALVSARALGRNAAVAAEVGVFASLATIAARLVAPPGPGQLENGVIILVLAMVAYLASLGILAHAMAAQLRVRAPTRFQFGTRTMLAVVTGLGVLLALGTFGYWMAATLAIGGLYFYWMLRTNLRTQRILRMLAKRRTRGVLAAAESPHTAEDAGLSVAPR